MPRTIARAATAATLSALILPAAAAAPSEAVVTASKYRSCAQLHQEYPNGVGKKGAVDKSSGKPKKNPVRTFRVDTKLYNSLPKTLDRDRDGIACEAHTKAPAKKTSAPKKAATPTVTVKGKVITTREAAPGFTTPSGNIGCSLAGEMRCDIIEYTYRTPKKPSWCDTDFGGSMFLNRSAYIGCAGDTVFGEADLGRTKNTWFAKTGAKARGGQAVLPYGWTLRKGGFSCTSTTKGVTCTNLNTHHGFTLAKSAYRTF